MYTIEFYEAEERGLFKKFPHNYNFSSTETVLYGPEF